MHISESSRPGAANRPVTIVGWERGGCGRCSYRSGRDRPDGWLSGRFGI